MATGSKKGIPCSPRNHFQFGRKDRITRLASSWIESLDTASRAKFHAQWKTKTEKVEETVETPRFPIEMQTTAPDFHIE